jgi:hypothetical protein
LGGRLDIIKEELAYCIPTTLPDSRGDGIDALGILSLRLMAPKSALHALQGIVKVVPVETKQGNKGCERTTEKHQTPHVGMEGCRP